MFSLGFMLMAVLCPDEPDDSTRPTRLFLLALQLFWILVLGVWGEDWRGVEVPALMLFAQYALTIRTIPPLEEKQPSISASKQLR